MVQRMRIKPEISVFLLFSLVFLLIGLSSAIGADRFPRPQGAVNDFAGVIAPEYRRSMESISQQLLAKTGTSVVVATVKEIEGADPAEYANRLYESWGIGKKGEDKGVLIFLALQERKVRIETGYGVEGVLPDGLAGEILDRYVVPFLKKGDYGRGLSNAVMAVSSVIASDAGVTLSKDGVTYPRRDSTGKKAPSPFSYIIFFVILLMLLGTRRGRRMLPYILLAMMMGGGRRDGGGGFGGFSGGF